MNALSFRFITGSYDRTCKVWDTASGEELHTLEGHKNVVYAIAFNNPYGFVFKIIAIDVLSNLSFYRDKIATGSFDKTACIWSTERGTCYHTLRGHSGEIVNNDKLLSFFRILYFFIIKIRYVLVLILKVLF